MSNWYKDSILLLEEAEELLEQIKQIEIDSVKDLNKLNRAQPKVKNFLDNCRAPLDYLAVYLRDTYTNNKQRVYFPFAYNEHSFNNRIKNDFKNKLPFEVVSTIKYVLPFYNQSQCLGWLNLLTNENKHKKLSSKTKTLQQTINHMTLINGSMFSNVQINGFASPIKVNDVSYDLINNFPNNNADVTNKNIFIFKEYDLEAVILLTEILVTVQKLINDINQII